jgi:cobaltochelatase CobT
VDFGVAELFANLAGPLLLLAFVVLFVLWRRKGPQPVSDADPGYPYRVYTREFDLELRGDAVAAELPSASPDEARGWLETGDGKWREAIRRRNAYRAAREVDLRELAGALRRLFPAEEARTSVVSLLIDQSGSMKGAPMAAVAATAQWLGEALAGLGVRTEILGFSTAGWQGGHAYGKWKRSGRPPRPGRLCALMHVVYKSADETALGAEAADAMLNPDLLRENVDGEALLWAGKRLAGRPEARKLLLVLSDGAPVDDASLLHNGLSFLVRHLETVFAELERAGEVRIGAVGVGFAVDRYYALSSQAADLHALPRACVDVLERMTAPSGPPAVED